MSAITGAASGLRGTGYKQVSMPTMNPEQMDLFKQLLSGSRQGVGSGLDYLSKLAGGDQSQFEQLEAPALRQFAGLQGNIASRFSGMGSGARRSSGFQNTLGSSAGELSENLAARRMGLQQDAIKQLLGLSEQLLGQRTSENALLPKKRSFWQELLSGAAPGIGGAGGSGGTLGLLKLLGML
jgi:hypothetical protein